MAISQSFNYKGIDLNQAYFRLSAFSWRGETSSISLDVYASEDARTEGNEPLTSISFSMPLDLNNFKDAKTKAYNQMRGLIYSEIKKMDEFEGATDA